MKSILPPLLRQHDEETTCHSYSDLWMGPVAIVICKSCTCCSGLSFGQQSTCHDAKHSSAVAEATR